MEAFDKMCEKYHNRSSTFGHTYLSMLQVIADGKDRPYLFDERMGFDKPHGTWNLLESNLVLYIKLNACTSSRAIQPKYMQPHGSTCSLTRVLMYVSTYGLPDSEGSSGSCIWWENHTSPDGDSWGVDCFP